MKLENFFSIGLIQTIRIVQIPGILLCLLLSAQFLHAQEENALDVENGFFGIPFGSNIDSLKGFKYMNPYQQKDRFIKTDLPLKYGGVKLAYVNFIFYKKELHSVVIKTEGKENSTAILDVLTMFYGEGDQDGMGPLYHWNGKKVYMVYDQNILSHNAQIIIESRAMQKKFEHDWGNKIGN